MSGIMVASVVGGGASMAGASKSANAASAASDAQKASAAGDLAFRQKQYDRYLGLIGPIEDKLSAEAQSNQPLDYDQNAARIKQNYANASRNITSSMGMRGMAGSGLDAGAMRGAALQQAGDLSGAYATGLQNRRNLGLTLANKNQIQNAATGVGQGMQGLTNLYGQQAGMYNQAAAQGWQGFGQNMNQLAVGLDRRYNQPQPDITIPQGLPPGPPPTPEPMPDFGSRIYG